MCGAPWTAARDIPDVAGWSDLVAAPEAVHERLLRRIEDGRCPTASPTVTLPKPGSLELRKLTWMDPFDEVWMRILVGRMVASIDASLDIAAEVFSYRLESSIPAWRLMDHRTAHRLRRARGAELLAQDHCKGVGTLDVRHYYPSVTPDSLAGMLATTSAAPGATALLCQFLARLQPLGMPQGLPIGPEASGVLGNVMLIDVDRELSPIAGAHIRYTDDSWVFLEDACLWEEVVQTFEAAAARVGLGLNRAKVAFHAKEDGAADDALSSGRVDSMIAAAGGYVPPEVAAEELEHQLSLPEPDWTAIRFGLGALAREASTAGLELIYANPELFIEAPVNTGDYLMALARQKRSRGRIDRDWIVGFATSMADGRSIAAKVHACRVAHGLRVGRAHGNQLGDVAMSAAHPRNVPLQAWAAAAWGTSEAHRPGAAIANARHVGELPIRRAFALSVKPESSSQRKCRRWARGLSTVEPDLIPTLKALES